MYSRERRCLFVVSCWVQNVLSPIWDNRRQLSVCHRLVPVSLSLSPHSKPTVHVWGHILICHLWMSSESFCLGLPLWVASTPQADPNRPRCFVLAFQVPIPSSELQIKKLVTKQDKWNSVVRGRSILFWTDKESHFILYPFTFVTTSNNNKL